MRNAKLRMIVFVSVVVAGVLAAIGAGLAQPAGKPAGRVRPAALASEWYPYEGWYPGLRSMATLEMHRFFRDSAAAPALTGKPVALVVPHAGWKYSGLAAASAFRTLKRGDFARVVVVAPSHHSGFEGFAVDDAAAYQTPLGDIPVCSDAVKKVLEEPAARVVPGVADPEHSIEIELPFLQQTLGGFCLVPVLAGRTTPGQEKALAQKLASLDDGKTLFVFSSDFTHYGPNYDYTPFGPSASFARDKIRAQDDRAIGLLSGTDAGAFRDFIQETGATICGRSGLATLLELLPRIAPKARTTLTAHYASGDLEGNPDKDNSVDYVSLAYTREAAGAGAPLTAAPIYATVPVDAPPLSAADGQRLVRLARAALQTELLGQDDLPRELAALPAGALFGRKQAVFVTLNRTRAEEIAEAGRLRGCVGQIEPVHPLYSAVVHAAVDAALHDRRFIPVHPVELTNLAVEVTVLSPPRPIPAWRDIKLGTHGIVLEKNNRRAVFLPQVPGEQGWTLEQTLTALSEKAGLDANAWREGAKFYVFTGQVIEEAGRAAKP